MINKISQSFYDWAKGWVIFILFLLDGFFRRLSYSRSFRA